MIPVMPLPVAFALAAIVSPTDPIAVSAIANRVPIPRRLLHILEGESLLNDASGLVCMRFAVAAALTGAFSLTEARRDVPVACTWRHRYWHRRDLGRHRRQKLDFPAFWRGNRISDLVSLLIPFGAYLLAEHFHCSGILAAVAAGITMSYAEQTGQALPITRVRRVAVWDLIQFAANGIIFVLLGEQLPQIIRRAAVLVQDTGHRDPLWLIAYIVAINLALAGLRFAWVWASLRFTLFRAAKRGEKRNVPSWRLVVATSLAGVRGAITLAGVLTLPMTLMDGTAFPSCP